MAAVGQEKKAEATRQRSRRHCKLCLSFFAVLLGIWIGPLMCSGCSVGGNGCGGDGMMVMFLLFIFCCDRFAAVMKRVRRL